MEANNKLIAEFMGYKLAKLYIGLAWESPYKNSVEDTFELHGRLWRENDSYYKFHTSWDWLMPVVEQCLEKHNNLIDGRYVIDTPYSLIAQALQAVSLKETYNAVVEFIKDQNN